MNMYVWIIILGGAIVTILPKVLPIMIVSKFNLNNKISKFLKFIPISILSTLIISQVFVENNKLNINIPEMIALIPTIIVSLKKDSLLLTVIIGVISLALLRIIYN